MGKVCPTTELGRYGFLDDRDGRALRGRRIVAMLRDFTRLDLDAARALDIGCSAGLVTQELARHMQSCVGVDSDVASVRWAAANAEAANLRFVAASGDALPFTDASFDVVVCNHVYEHVRDPTALMAEIHRVLVPGGACWFAGGHTIQLLEPHFRLPLLTMLPRSLASALLRWTKRGRRYEIAFLAPWALPRLFVAFADARLVSVDALREPAKYELNWPLLRMRPIRGIVRLLAAPLAWCAPTHLWLLRKRGPPDRLLAHETDQKIHQAPDTP